jgi:hypothetical protein
MVALDRVSGFSNRQSHGLEDLRQFNKTAKLICTDGTHNFIGFLIL